MTYRPGTFAAEKAGQYEYQISKSSIFPYRVVKDAATSEPLPGVVLIFEGIADGAEHREGTQTWADGSYILEIPEGIEGVLTLHMIGYSDVMSGSFKLKKGEELVMDFEMQTEAQKESRIRDGADQ